ncbi:DUF257 family protein [Thermococcus radiotolerans]|uniref:KaiC-like domain-containing protein n=1 Tax=Thermococcus radiotolerans TaxID=187880 RepID=A0A2Z2N2R8_9EURY|nr:DUF257 family protein [Thermococcus radiotolerans]ASJ14640.1 hypothetical protein A3L10_05645 [Thermococcus radiotolerans]
MEQGKVAEIIDSVLPGETVLVTYTTSYIPEFALKFFIEYSREKGIPLVIDDNFDTLHAIIIHAKTMGLSLDLDNVYVLKTGGKFETGNVLTRVPFHPDPRVYIKNYEESSVKVFREIPSPMINLVLGLENLFLVTRTPLDTYRIILAMQRFTGNERRKAFYLINEGIMKSLPLKSLYELERISTTVIRLRPYHTGAEVKVLKSINPNLVGLETTIDAGEWS